MPKKIDGLVKLWQHCWTCMNLLKFHKTKCNVLHMGWGNPKDKCRLAREYFESSSERERFGILVDEKLNMTSNVHLQPKKSIVSLAV